MRRAMKQAIKNPPRDPYGKFAKAAQPDEADIPEDLIEECMNEYDYSRRVALATIKAGKYP